MRKIPLGWLTRDPIGMRRDEISNHFFFRGQSLCGVGVPDSRMVYDPTIQYCSRCSDILDSFADLNNQFAIDRYATREKEKAYAR
jgi:hypothetical protein